MSSEINPHANSAAQLREARRRRILENMDQRLKKISALPSESGKYNTASLIQNPESRNSFPSADLNNEWDVINERTCEPPLPENIKETPLPEFLRPVNLQDGHEVQESKLNKLFRNDEFHIILLAIVVFFAFYLNLGVIMYENILCPFITLELVKLPSKWNSPSAKPFLISALLMLRAPSKSLNTFIELVFRLLTLTKDLFLYIFVFIVCNEIVSTLNA